MSCVEADAKNGVGEIRDRQSSAVKISNKGVAILIPIGIDPGKSGAIVVIFPDGPDRIRLDQTEKDVADWLNDVTSEKCFCYIEKVNAMPKQGVSSTFKFGKSFGFLIGLLSAFRVPHEFVTPSKWQREMGCLSGGDKNVTKQKAQQLFPKTEWKITHKEADALLIAEYCRRSLTG